MRVLETVVVATDSHEVAEVCHGFGARVVLTRDDHPSGTDRVAEVAALPEFSGFDVVVNVQGDEPLVSEDHVEAAAAMVAPGGWDIGTCAGPLGTIEALREPSVVKVVRAESGRALYFSRAPIPHRRDGSPGADELSEAPYLRHIGIYAYGPEALARWVALPPSPLERLERLEQLRPLEAGMEIGVALVDEAEGGVDTPEDAARIANRLAEPGAPERTQVGR
jgi:3-deoxy-manno-octulosonate cytidylyltransferase (CMP-KDO synthetase)